MSSTGARGLDCNELVELVTDYLDGALPSEEQARFEHHLAECPGCVTYVERIKKVIALSGQHAEMPPVEPSVRERLLRAFRAAKG